MFTKKILKQVRNKEEKQALQQLNTSIQQQTFFVTIIDGVVKGLSLKFCDLGHIPPEITAFRQIEHIDLSFNDISLIAGLNNCVSLKMVNLSYNKLEEIKNLENLVDLRVLDLSNNHIKAIEGIYNQRNLTRLNLSNNNIVKIRSLDRCQGLMELHLDFNPIPKLEGLEYLPELQTISVNYADLSKIQGLESLPNLATLKLSGNQIKSIEGLEKCSNLTELDVRNNSIFQIEGIQALDNLTSILLSGNPLFPAELYYVDKSSSIIINYAKQKYETQEALKLGKIVINEEDRGQIDEELAFETQILHPGTSQEIRDKLQSKNQTEILGRSAPDLTNDPGQKSRQSFGFTPMPVKASTRGTKQSQAPADSSADLSIPPVPNQSASGSTPSANTGSAPRLATKPVPYPNIVPVLNQKFETETEWMSYANDLYMKNDYNNALLAYRNVIQFNLNNLEAWLYMGISFNNKGDYVRSIRTFKQGIKILPSYSPLWMYLGISHFNSGEKREAVHALEEAIRLDPRNQQAIEYLGQIQN